MKKFGAKREERNGWSYEKPNGRVLGFKNYPTLSTVSGN